MQTCILATNGEQYGGQYVAIKSFADRELICHGKEPSLVLKEAREKGYEAPVIFYVPEKDMIHIY